MQGRTIDRGQRETVYEGGGIRLSLFTPSARLAPYITVFYRTEAPGPGPVEDFLPPEWANLRTGRGSIYEAAIGEGPLVRVPPIILSGPTSRVTRLCIGGGYDSWGVGLLPLGLAKFFGVNASDYADRYEDLALLPQFADFGALMDTLMRDPGDVEANVDRLEAAFTALLDRPVEGAGAIVATHLALLSEEDPTVSGVASAVGVSPRTLERYCKRWFGFPPQLLLRRQRFLRSLAKFMVDPSMKWIASLDTHYHDQAHFLRDFRRFLGMKPSEYAAMEHPIAITAARARMETLGEAMQVLHPPPENVAA